MCKKKIIIVMWIAMFISVFFFYVNDKINEVVEEESLVFSSLDEFESNFEVAIEEEEKEVALLQIEVNEIVERQTNVNDVVIKGADVGNEDEVMLCEVKNNDKIQRNEVTGDGKIQQNEVNSDNKIQQIEVLDDEIQQIEVNVENEVDIAEYDFIVEKYDVKFSLLQSVANDELNNLIEVFKEEYQNLSLKEKNSLSTKTFIAAKYVKYAKELESRIDVFFDFMIDDFKDELVTCGYDATVTYGYIDVYENEKETRKSEILKKALN